MHWGLNVTVILGLNWNIDTLLKKVEKKLLHYTIKNYIKIVCHFAKTAKTLGCIGKCPIHYSILN